MEKILKISIPNYSQRQKSKPYIVYHISITAPVRSWTVQHRYNEFFNLNKKFIELGLKPPLELPPKSSIFSFTSFDNPNFIETRRQGLEEYLQAILASRDERFKKLPEWREFLGLSHLKNRNGVEGEDSNSINGNNNGNNTSANSSIINDTASIMGNKRHSFIISNENSSNSNGNLSGNYSQSSLNIKSSEQWLEECRDLSLVINEIRTCIAARNKFAFRNETAAACEAIVLARKNHNILCTKYAELERELHRQMDEYYNNVQKLQLQQLQQQQMDDSAGVESYTVFFSSVFSGGRKKENNKPTLSKGEFSRRQDLLENIRMEKEQLEKLLGNMKSSESYNSSSSSQNQSLSTPVYFNTKVSSSSRNSNILATSFGSNGSGNHNQNNNNNSNNNNNNTSKVKSRRKFGVNISQKVEENTQGLDNIQILQLQKDMLKDQDKTLEQFSSILNRQRRIGETINQELDLQNELLEDLDVNVNKVQLGLGQAEKRMKKVLKKK